MIAAAPLRIDTRARLIGYVMLWSLNARSWRGLNVSASTRNKVRGELSDVGVDIHSVE